ncbi:DUF4870 domain-containing protein [Lacisediminihabitans changchengi]|uniref:DUF4870 domain-containing protein n=1 Tax=Lacisediminihabitans changchengi TaxID=2787634 RepID=A0A934W2V9_9MICO|nr:DUF4870 domain-containing protein [Lacisediminihabitans changchengi]MBK4346594.1 DUF4870 domain-containing protein [Lacisediminihabitans changchengi]
MTQPPPAAPAPQPAVPLSEAEDRQWASFAHLGGILSILPSLIIFLVFKDRGTFTRQESKEALNFQITILIAEIVLGIVGTILSVALLFVTYGGSSIFGGLGWIAWLIGLIFSIIAFTKAKDGIAYRYPFNFRFIK